MGNHRLGVVMNTDRATRIASPTKRRCCSRPREVFDDRVGEVHVERAILEEELAAVAHDVLHLRVALAEAPSSCGANAVKFSRQG
jgi:hypothetical protein